MKNFEIKSRKLEKNENRYAEIQNNIICSQKDKKKTDSSQSNKNVFANNIRFKNDGQKEQQIMNRINVVFKNTQRMFKQILKYLNKSIAQSFEKGILV